LGDVATLAGREPEEDLYAPLLVPPIGENVGTLMSREAVSRLVLASQRGMSYDRVADLFEHLKGQIEEKADGWRATRARCVDGSVVFLGDQYALVITPEGGIYRGNTLEPNALVTARGGGFEGKDFVFGPPNLEAAVRRIW
jgi:hypothetical protein